MPFFFHSMIQYIDKIIDPNCRSAGPVEHFQIKWGQAYAVVVRVVQRRVLEVMQLCNHWKTYPAALVSTPLCRTDYLARVNFYCCSFHIRLLLLELTFVLL